MKISLISIFPDIMSFGIRTISACLKKEGHDVDLIFLLNEFPDRYEKKTMDDLAKLTKRSDLIGITLMTNFWDNAVQITKKIKENSNATVLWGGAHPTIRPEECLDHADMVCIGEGEETLIELTRKMQNKQDYYDTQGMGFNNKGKKIVNKFRALPGTKSATITHLDQIPFQDQDYKSHFVQKGENIIKMDLETMEQRGEWYMTLPTRGCPFKCTFCINNTFHAMYPHQKPVRKRSVDNVIKELQEVKSKMPFAKIILFDDDAFFIMSTDEIRDFSQKYKKHIRLPLAVYGVTPSTINEEKVSLLVDAGLVGMRMGIQTAGEKTKVLYKRPHSNTQVEKAVNMVNKYKDQVKAYYDIILDSPWDTDENTIETLMFLSKLPTPYQITIFSLVFFPGTDLYTKAKKEGLIKDDLNDIYRKHYHEPKKTYLNGLFYELEKYSLVGIGISPKIMFFLTHKITKQLHLHWFSLKILKLLFPFFRYIGRTRRSTKKSTHLYRKGWEQITRKEDYYEKVIKKDEALTKDETLPKDKTLPYDIYRKHYHKPKKTYLNPRSP